MNKFPHAIRCSLFGLVGYSLWVLPLQAAEVRGKAEDFLGSWEMLILGTNSTFSCGSIDVEKEGDVLKGEMVFRWGSVWPFRGPEAAKISEAGELLISNGDWAKPMTLRRIGGVLEGSVEMKSGEKFSLWASKSSADVDLSGKWNVVVRTPQGDDRRGVLRLEDFGQGRIIAEAVDEQEAKVKIQDVQLDGEKLTFRFTPPGEWQSFEFAGHVRGDRLEGRISLGDGTTIDAAGMRERIWPEPIQLLKENGLDGWKPRDARGKFGWMCADGVLTNDPPDVDIVSERTFKDFRLSLEYKVERQKDAQGREVRSNSGIYLRGRYEVQILDDYGEGVQSHGNGAVYSRIVPSENATAAPGQWQKYEITLIGHYLTVVLNGKTIIDNQRLRGITGGAWHDPFQSLSGPLLLQGDHGKIWFRSIAVTPAMPSR